MNKSFLSFFMKHFLTGIFCTLLCNNSAGAMRPIWHITRNTNYFVLSSKEILRFLEQQNSNIGAEIDLVDYNIASYKDAHQKGILTEFDTCEKELRNSLKILRKSISKAFESCAQKYPCRACCEVLAQNEEVALHKALGLISLERSTGYDSIFAFNFNEIILEILAKIDNFLTEESVIDIYNSHGLIVENIRFAIPSIYIEILPRNVISFKTRFLFPVVDKIY